MVLKFTAPEKFVGHSYRSINFSRFGLVLISAVRKVTENNLLGLSSSREEILDLERKSMEEKIASRDEIIVMGTRKKYHRLSFFGSNKLRKWRVHDFFSKTEQGAAARVFSS